MRLYIPVESTGYSLTHPKGFKFCLRKMIDKIKYGRGLRNYSTNSGQTLRTMTTMTFHYEESTKDIVIILGLGVPDYYYCDTGDILLGGVHNKNLCLRINMKIKIGR